MKTLYLQIIFSFLLITAIIQFVFGENKNPGLKMDNRSSKPEFNEFSSILKVDPCKGDTSIRSIIFRDYFNSEDSTFVWQKITMQKVIL